MKNNRVVEAERQGYNFQGATARPWVNEEVEKIHAHCKELNKELRPWGAHAKVLQVVETTPSRGGGEHKYRYLAIYVKYTDSYREHLKAVENSRKHADRVRELRELAGKLQDWEIDFIVSCKRTNLATN